MNPSDLFLILACITFLGCSLLLGSGFARRSATLIWWGSGYGLGGLGMVVIIAAQRIGSTLLANTGSALVLCAYGMLCVAMGSLSDKRRKRYWIIPLGLIWIPVALIPPLPGNALLRMIVFGPFAATFMLTLAWYVFRLPARPPARLPLAALALFHACFACGRSAALIASYGPAAHRFWLYATPIEGMFFLFSDAFLVMNLVRSVEESALLQEAHTDFLTGVLSRRQFSKLAQKALRQGPCSILILDIDHFKAVNDQFGHAVGDTVLREVGRICQQEAGQSDLVGRLGGDEFAILVTSSDETARSIATRITGAFGLKCQAMGWPASISVGMAGNDDTKAALDSLIGQADQQLYNAKRRRPRPAA